MSFFLLINQKISLKLKAQWMVHSRMEGTEKEETTHEILNKYFK